MEKPKIELQRQQAIAWAIMLTANEPLPRRAEPPAAQIRHILYHSRACRPFSDAQLLELQSQAQAFNEQHDITGLLCYSQGYFVQLFEGPSRVVGELFESIRRDTRHQQVDCLRDGTDTARWFPDWQLALAQPDSLEFYWLTSQFTAYRHSPVARVPITEPHLLTLLHAFSELGTC